MARNILKFKGDLTTSALKDLSKNLEIFLDCEATGLKINRDRLSLITIFDGNENFCIVQPSKESLPCREDHRRMAKTPHQSSKLTTLHNEVPPLQEVYDHIHVSFNLLLRQLRAHRDCIDENAKVHKLLANLSLFHVLRHA